MRTTVLLWLLLPWTVVGAPKTLLNVDKAQLAIQGYDPVAFFTEHKPVKGKPELTSVHEGAVYRFSTAEHKAAFDREPVRYEPSFGGYCAYGVSRNKLVEVDVNAFQVVDGHLLLQYSLGVRDDFNQDPQGNLAKAKTNWPGLVEKKGRPISPSP